MQLTFLQARGRYASLTRDRAPDDPELVAARQQMQEAALLRAIEKALAKAPISVLTRTAGPHANASACANRELMTELNRR